MNCIEKIESIIAKPLIQTILLIIFNFLFFLLFDHYHVFENLSKGKIITPFSIADVIAILTLLTLVLGVIYYVGQKWAQEKYRLKMGELGIINILLIRGAIFISNIIIAVFLYYTIKAIETQLVMQYSLPFLYIVLLCGLVVLFGYAIEKQKHTIKNNNITLKMVNSNDPIKDLELFDITDKDYRFKDLEGNEYIVPIGQVEIVYSQQA